MVASSVVLWKYASKISKNNKEYYKCNVGSCQYEAVFAGTAAIKSHLKGHDGVKLTEEEEEDNSKNKTNLANKELLYFIVSGFLLFGIVDNYDFRDLDFWRQH